MSKGWMNLRIFSWHIHGGDTRWWSISISRNGYHKAKGWPDGYFSWY